MGSSTRRRFLQTLIGSGGLLLSGCRTTPFKNHNRAQVVVVGGGFAGASAAKYLRLLDPNLQITLLEPKTRYITCPTSNWLLADMLNLEQLSLDYRTLRDKYSIQVIVDSVLDINSTQRKLRLSNGDKLGYDRLILSPGIAFLWDKLPGYSEETAQRYPHAWQAGPQTLLLQQQLHTLPAGGLAVISVPAEPYRCPPGPYERASLMAYWLKQHNPKAKIIILDAKTGFSKQKLFEAGWTKHFGYGSSHSLIEWHSIADNPLVRLDPLTATLETYFGDKFKAELLNIIPPQQAGHIAVQSGLTDSSGWCPVDPVSCRSNFDEYIHIIGDAANYAPIPKSAFAANSEAKVCAMAVVNLLREQPLSDAHWLNTCYSLITPAHGISVAGVYKVNTQQKIELVKNAGGVSRIDDGQTAIQEAEFAKSVYATLVEDSFS